MESIEWPIQHSFEIRTLGMWHHGARRILGLTTEDMYQVNLRYAANLTGYSGFAKRIHALVVDHCEGQKK